MRRRFAPLAALASAFLVACGDGGTAPAGGRLPATLVGGWEAGPPCLARGCRVEARVEGTSLVLPLTDSVHLVLDIRETGGVVSTITFGALPPRTVQGTGRVRADTLVVDYPGTPSDTIVYGMQGALLRFDFRNALQLVDVTGDGVPDRLRIGVLLSRR